MPSALKKRKSPSDRRKDIIEAAVAQFSKKGYTGATTRNMAADAGVHEAVLFRHFSSKEELYSAALEARLTRNRQSALEKMEKCAKKKDDRGFFEALALGLLTRFESDPSIPRLILYSALEEHEPLDVVMERQLRVEKPTLDYITMRIHEGAFRKLDPDHAVLAFGAMLFGYIVRQQVLRMSSHKAYDRKKIAKSLVAIFLNGMKQ